MLKFIFIFSPFFLYSQQVVNYEFNNKLDTVFYTNIANVLYVKKGKPISLNEDVIVTHINRKTYAVEIKNKEIEEIELLIVQENINPETKEKEEVIIDKIPIVLNREEVTIDLCIGENSKDVYEITNENINVCSSVNGNFKILSYNMVIDKKLIQVMGSKFNENVVNAINSCTKNKEIQFEAVYIDILKRKKTMVKTFVKK
jgi:hypothetical protein